MEATSFVEAHNTGLKRESLSFVETLAQSIANIAPTVTPALAIPLVFASAGNGTWLAYVLATIGLVMISVCINQFARRSATSGSLYSYTTTGLGHAAGFLTGWSLIFAYITTAAVVAVGFTIFAQDLMGRIGVDLPVYVSYLVCVALAWLCAYKDIQLSARMMLVLEAVSVAAILVLGVIIFANSPAKVDMPQLTLTDVSSESIRLGMILAVLSFVGFESATALGGEARQPFKNIPRSVIVSTILVGVFFVAMSYLEVMGFRGHTDTLDKSTAPTTALAEFNGVPLLGVVIAVGALLSFFSCTLACINASARVMFAMGRDGLLPTNVGQAHTSNATPHVAVTVASVATFVVCVVTSMGGVALLDAYAYIGTITTLGFLLVYIMIAIAAVVYLRRLNALKWYHVGAAALGIIGMLLPTIGSVYPVPAYPFNLLPYLFLLYMALGAGYLFTRPKPAPLAVPQI